MQAGKDAELHPPPTTISSPPSSCCAQKHPAAVHPGEVSVKRAELGKLCGWGEGGGRGEVLECQCNGLMALAVWGHPAPPTHSLAWWQLCEDCILHRHHMG